MSELNFHGVVVAKLTDVVALGAGDNRTCVSKSDASLWCWGKFGHQAINGSYTHKMLLGPQGGGTAVATGEKWTCVVKNDGSLTCVQPVTKQMVVGASCAADKSCPGAALCNSGTCVSTNKTCK